jgi:hypothetical protein
MALRSRKLTVTSIQERAAGLAGANAPGKRHADIR